MRPASGLSRNEERPSDMGIHHFWSTGGGLTTVLRKYLEDAKPDELRFGRRVASIRQGTGHQRWHVSAVDGSVSDPHGNHVIQGQMGEDFDAVFMTGTAWDAQQVLRTCTTGKSMDWYLNNVHYDTRVTLGLVLNPAVTAAV